MEDHLPPANSANRAGSRTGWWRAPFVLVLKLAVTGGLVVWLVSSTDLDLIASLVARADLSLVALSVVLHIAAFILAGTRWWLLLHRLEPTAQLGAILPSYYLGVFANHFLPTSMGGDVVRTVHLRRTGLSISHLVGSAVVDRTIGLFSVLLMAAACGALVNQAFFRLIGASAWSMAVTLIAGAGLGFVLWRSLTAWLGHIAPRYEHTHRRRGLIRLVQALDVYRAQPGLVAGAIALSIAMQSFIVICYVILGQSLGIGLMPMAYFAIVPIVFLASSLPVSLGGLGVREGSLVIVLGWLGVSDERATALSALYLLVLWLASLPGAIVMVMGRSRAVAKLDG